MAGAGKEIELAAPGEVLCTLPALCYTPLQDNTWTHLAVGVRWDQAENEKARYPHNALHNTAIHAIATRSLTCNGWTPRWRDSRPRGQQRRRRRWGSRECGPKGCTVGSLQGACCLEGRTPHAGRSIRALRWHEQTASNDVFPSCSFLDIRKLMILGVHA